MTRATRSLRSIIFITFSIEGIGALLLFFGLWSHGDMGVPQSVVIAAFHSVSAFCNAGFSLFTDNLEGFKTDGFIVLSVAILIIFGGMSFSVIANLRGYFVNRLRRTGTSEPIKLERLGVNTRVVLLEAGLLLLVGTPVIYGLEHGNTMVSYSLRNQYLSALFQSVLLRTAAQKLESSTHEERLPSDRRRR